MTSIRIFEKLPVSAFQSCQQTLILQKHARQTNESSQQSLTWGLLNIAPRLWRWHRALCKVPTNLIHITLCRVVALHKSVLSKLFYACAHFRENKAVATSVCHLRTPLMNFWNCGCCVKSWWTKTSFVNFPNDHLTTMRSHAWQKKGPSIQSTKAWRPAAFQSSPWRCKEKQEALILLAVLENCRKSTTGPPTNTWRLAFQSCTIANTNWRSSAFCVDVVALYQKQGPVFSLNSKSILGYKF